MVKKPFICHYYDVLKKSSPNIDWAWEWADLVYVLAEGKLVASGAAEAILNNSQFSGVLFSKPVIGEMFNKLIGS